MPVCSGCSEWGGVGKRWASYDNETRDLRIGRLHLNQIRIELDITIRI